VISDEVFANITRSCNFNLSDGKACSDAMAAYDSANADPFDIYGPVCIDAPDGTYYPSRYVRYCIFLDSTTSDYMHVNALSLSIFFTEQKQICLKLCRYLGMIHAAAIM
jgi:hypothetical protein